MNKEQRLVYAKEYRIAHKKELAEQARIYAQTHKEQVAEYQKKYREKHKAEQHKYFRKWYKQHSEQMKALVKKWREQHQESYALKRKESDRLYRLKHREHRKEYDSQRKKTNLHEKKNREILQASTVIEIIGLYLDGYSLKQVADKIGIVKKSTVGKVLAQKGVKRRNNKESRLTLHAHHPCVILSPFALFWRYLDRKHVEKHYNRYEYTKRWRDAHREQYLLSKRASDKKRRDSEKGHTAIRAWWHSEKGRRCQHLVAMRRYSDRKKYGCNFLNQPFTGSHGHHIDKATVVFIPEQMHLSVGHSLVTGKNMSKINELSLNWLNNPIFH